MNNGHDKADDATVGVPARRDGGVTFVELLISVVLIGLVVVGLMTALATSVRGSDQHRSKIGALADLESAGAYLAREGRILSCPVTQLEVESILATKPGGSNPGVSLSVNGAPDCTTGLPLISLTATHDNGNATESLSVLVSGITVLSPGEGSGGGPGPGPCTWGTLSANNLGLTASGNKLNQPLTVQLSYSGDCSSIPVGSVTATLTATVSSGPSSSTLTLIDSGTGIFQATYGVNALKFKSGAAALNTNVSGVPTYSFTIG